MTTNVAARLDKSGRLYTNTNIGVELNEITQITHSITPHGVYAGEFDEVTTPDNNRVMQQKKTGKLIISGVFDEVSGIS
jgi:hypothetical protein